MKILPLLLLVFMIAPSCNQADTAAQAALEEELAAAQAEIAQLTAAAAEQPGSKARPTHDPDASPASPTPVTPPAPTSLALCRSRR